MIKNIILFLLSILFVVSLLELTGCEFAENGLVKEQAVTFEQEVAYWKNSWNVELRINEF